MAEGPDNIDLDAAWTQRLHEASQWLVQNGDIKEGLTPEDLAGKIRQRGEASSNKDKGDKWETLAKMALNVGNLLLNVTQIAVSVASQIMGPVQMGMNAINFFVDAAVRCHNVYGDLEKLFGQIATALERFGSYREYQKYISKSTKRVACKILAQFVAICQIGYNIYNGGVRKTMMRNLSIALFNDKGEVSRALQALDQLTKEELQINATQANVQSAAANEQASAARVGVDYLVSQGDKDKTTKFLEEKLKNQGGDQDEVRRALLVGTMSNSGAWLEKHEAFQSWMDLGQSEQRMLILQGVEGSGKSVLSAKIAKLIRDKYPRVTETAKHASVAFFGFASSGTSEGQGPLSNNLLRDKASTTNSDRSAVNLHTALRNMALQLAKDDAKYRQSLFSSLQKQDDLPEDIYNLFKALFVDSSSSATFFLLFDEIQELGDNSNFASLLKSIEENKSDAKNIRLLASCRPHALDSVKSLGGAPHVELGDENGDLQAFVTHEVKELRFLQDSDPDMVQLRQEISDTLVGSKTFKTVRYLLREIESKQRAAEIREVLETAKSQSNLVVHLLNESNKLKDNDIKDLNTLLEWVIGIPYDMRIYNLAEIVRLRNPEGASFKPLARRMDEEFNGFFEVNKDTGTVALAEEAIKTYFKDLTEKAADLESVEAPITETEIKMLTRILHNFCEDDLYDKFGFEAFFESKRLKGQSKVYVNTDNATTHVALDNMRFANRNGTEMQKMMARSWPWHLSDIEISLLDQRLKAEIGKHLIPMFLEDAAMDRWYDGYEVVAFCICGEDYAEMLLKWFGDAGARKLLTKTQREWAEQAVSTSGQAAGELYLPILKYIACNWLSDELSIRDAYNKREELRSVVGEFLVKIKHSSFGETLVWGDYKSEELDAIAEWIKKVTDLTTPSAATLCKLAMVYDFEISLSKAVEMYHEAEKQDPKLYEATAFRAIALNSLGKSEEAIELMTLVVDMQQKSERNDDEALWENQSFLAKWHAKLGHYEETSKIYHSRLADKPLDFKTIHELIDIQNREKGQQSSKDLFHRLAEQKIEENDTLTTLLLNLEEPEDLYDVCCKAKEADCLDLLRETLSKAIDLSIHKHKSARNRPEEYIASLSGLLRLHSLGISWLWYHTAGPPERQKLLRQAEKAIELPATSDYDIYWIRRRLIFTLCFMYFQQAEVVSSDSESQTSFISKIKAFQSETDFVEPNEIDLILAAHYASQENLAAARNLLQANVKSGLDLLSDDTEENDWYGYKLLGKVFMRCRDDRNALAAFSMIGPTEYSDSKPTEPDNDSSSKSETTGSQALDNGEHAPESAKESSQAPQDTEPVSKAEKEASQAPQSAPTDESPNPERVPIDGPMKQRCDGCRTHLWNYADDIFWCRVCIDVQLCPACYKIQLERPGDAHLNLLHCRGHDFFHIPPWDDAKAQRLGKDMIEVDGQAISVEDWKTSIKTAWNITDAAET